MHFKRVSLFTQDSYFSYRIIKIIQEIKKNVFGFDQSILIHAKTLIQYKQSFLNLLD
jgi:hypothetical protein